METVDLIRESTLELLLFHHLKIVLRKIEHSNLIGADKIIIFIVALNSNINYYQHNNIAPLPVSYYICRGLIGI